MKKKSKILVTLKLLAVLCLGALALRIAFMPPKPHAPATSVSVKIEQPPAQKPSVPTGEEWQTAGNIISVMPEHETIVPPGHRPQIAIVIDDMGLSLSGSKRAMKLPAYVTLSFMPYAQRLDEQTAEAQENGHELLLHMPMEPVGHEDPGPGALLTKLSAEENRVRLDKALDSFEGFDGINNHMGSRFTTNAAAMEIVIEELQKRHLFFLDSRTSVQSVGFTIAQKHDVPSVSRDVFLDDILTADAIRMQLEATEHAARRKGHAVAIGHPHEVTLQMLETWLPEAEKRGFTFVPVHDLVRTSVVRVNGP